MLIIQVFRSNTIGIYAKKFQPTDEKCDDNQEMPQSHNAYQRTAPRNRGTEHQQPHDSKKTIKLKQPAFYSPGEVDLFVSLDGGFVFVLFNFF